MSSAAVLAGAVPGGAVPLAASPGLMLAVVAGMALSGDIRAVPKVPPTAA